jgi:hypothetical protein
MALDDMLCAGPIYLHRFKGQYRCVWTPLTASGGVDIHGIGIADTPYIAMSRAYKSAVDEGYKRPA